MKETPRQLKKAIDEKWKKNAKNKNKLVKYIENYNLVDKTFKEKIKQKILESFEKNERAEKNNELYLTITKELKNIDDKYKELDELREKLKNKKREYSLLIEQFSNQNIDGTDKTTLNLQMNNLRNLKTYLKTMETEIEKDEKEINNKESELKSIEETYGEKDDTASSDDTTNNTIEDNNQDNSPSEVSVEKNIFEKPKTLQEFKEKVLREKGKIEHTRGEILRLLNEGTGIDDSLRQEIETKISDTFSEYDAKQEGTLRMKSARYLEKKDDILSGNAFEVKTREIGGKITYKDKNKDGKWGIMWGEEEIGNGFDEVENPIEIGGKPAIIFRKDGKYGFIWGNKKQEGFDAMNFDGREGIGGKPVIRGRKGRKSYKMWGDETLVSECDTTYLSKNIGGKPVFRFRKNGKYGIMWGEEEICNGFDKIGLYDIKEIGGKLVFCVRKNGKKCIMRGKEKYSDWFDCVGIPVEIRGKPAFWVEKNGKWCLMRGKEQCGDWFDASIDDELFDNENNLIEFFQKNFGSIEKIKTSEEIDEQEESVETEVGSETPREKREKVILEWYQKKLNRDELLKIIQGIDQKDKRKLEEEILRNFYEEFEKVKSDGEYQEWDSIYRELKRAERVHKKGKEVIESKKSKLKSEIMETDERLTEIANSAMELEDESRWKIWKKGKLNKAKDEWDNLRERQKEILQGIRKLDIEKKRLELDLSAQNKRYGYKRSLFDLNRKVVIGKVLKKYEGFTKEKLGEKCTLKGYRESYNTMVADKEKYMEELLRQIEFVDFGISDKKKKEIIEKIKLWMMKEIENLKGGDEVLNIANKTEEWLRSNWKDKMKEISVLSGEITKKNNEIDELKSKGKGNNTDEIFRIKKQEFDLKNELVELKKQYESIQSEINAKLNQYDGTNIDGSDEIIIETWDERVKRF